ncbi:MAG: RNHCP domain-containing protein [Bacteroidetes bacterium]|nr:RNHCP domain-containing protein [Bacteroidota bacterium]
MSRKFQKTTEDFICGNCGFKVTGDGYTNHCPECLFSMHVDINPGDRAAECGGLMKPVDLKVTSGSYIIRHKCLKCGHEKSNKSGKGDNYQMLIELSVKKDLL